MRTTLRIDDDLLRELRQRAAAQKLSLAEYCNRMLRQSLTQKSRSRRPFRQRVASLGNASLNLDKALSIAAALEDREVLRKMALRK